MPTSTVDLPFAQGALQLGDHEMERAFALALLDATEHARRDSNLRHSAA